MIIIDTALKEREGRGRPIRLGMVGAGFMGRGVANQVVNHVAGMRMSAVYARRIEQGVEAFTYATPGCEPVVARTQQALDLAIESGRPVVTDDPFLLCRSPHLDALIDVTGAIELGAQVALEAFAHRKHLVLMNAELDATLGSILAVHAARSGVVLSTCDGDQPAVQINLHRFVTGLGLVPRLMGNIKGLQDRYRTPLTQRAFAEKWGQKPEMVTAFADGSKVNFEQAIVANATGLTVAKRGMLGYDHPAHIDTLTTRYDLDMLRAHGGIVEYVVGAQPGPGIFCLAEEPDDRQRHYLNLYKLGEGPLYCFYTPYHLCHFEAPNSVARAVLFGDSAGTPLRGPLVEVCAVAKRDLQAGEILDSYGHFMTYGEAVSEAECRSGRYLPEGLVEGCRLRRPIAKDQVLTYDDVDVPPGRVADRLYAEQQARFGAHPRTDAAIEVRDESPAPPLAADASDGHGTRTCRLCSAPLAEPVLNLGTTPLANSYLEAHQFGDKETYYPLRVFLCGSCRLAQLESVATPEEIFGRYAYFSSYSTTLLAHSQKYADSVASRLGLNPPDLVVEIASNDGYLLQYFQARGLQVLGVEPARNVAEAAMARGIPTVATFFGVATARQLVSAGHAPRLIVANNVVAHVPDVNDFLAGLKTLLAPGGTISLEFHHLYSLVVNGQFDTIYHEHFQYFSLESITTALARHGLSVVDVEELTTQGGSLRVYAQHAESATAAGPRVSDVLAKEAAVQLSSPATYLALARRVFQQKLALVTFLVEAKLAGKKVVCFGAAAKGNTLLNYCGVHADLVDYAVDSNPFKQGLFLPGSRIPVHGPDKVADTRPDYVVILPWNLRDEVMAQMAHIRSWGGRFVVPGPTLEIV